MKIKFFLLTVMVVCMSFFANATTSDSEQHHMPSLFHCFWSGPTFPHALRNYIKVWTQHFQRSGSKFKFILWVTHDSYTAAAKYLSHGAGNAISHERWKKYIPGLDYHLIKAKINYNTFYIASTELLLDDYPLHGLRAFFHALHKHKNYAYLSDIARYMILNKCSGIYSDVDYLTPNYNELFPESMACFASIFDKASKRGFFLPVIWLNRTFMVETQCVVLLPGFEGKLNPLINKIGRGFSDFASDEEQILMELAHAAEFQNHPRTKALNRSFFMSDKTKPMMQFFKERDCDKYEDTTDELYKGVCHKKNKYQKTFLLMNPDFKPGKIPMVEDGHRRLAYEKISEFTYVDPVDFFVVNCTFSNTRLDFNNPYSVRVWPAFQKYFNADDMEKQFEFQGGNHGKAGMYSWSNPGYSRLTRLEFAAKTIQKHRGRVLERLIKHSLDRHLVDLPIKKDVFKRFLSESGFRSFLRAKFGSVESMAKLKKLKVMLMAEMSRNRGKYLKKGAANRVLKKMLAYVMRVPGTGTATGRSLTGIINHPLYEQLKELINPNKSEVNYADLVTFVKG